MLRSSDRDAYAAFVGTLADRLRAVDRRLTVTVQAKTADQGTGDFHAAQDYEALGAAADEVRVMAYDHHWSTSDPGPIAPLGWVEDVVEYTLSRVPPEKVSLGIGRTATTGRRGKGQGQGTDVMGADAVALAEGYAATVQWDAEAQAPWFTYTEPDGAAHTVWYENARSIGLKADLAAHNGHRACVRMEARGRATADLGAANLRCPAACWMHAARPHAPGRGSTRSDEAHPVGQHSTGRQRCGLHHTVGR